MIILRITMLVGVKIEMADEMTIDEGIDSRLRSGATNV
jgi:hypothetical protein